VKEPSGRQSGVARAVRGVQPGPDGAGGPSTDLLLAALPPLRVSVVAIGGPIPCLVVWREPSCNAASPPSGHIFHLICYEMSSSISPNRPPHHERTVGSGPRWAMSEDRPPSCCFGQPTRFLIDMDSGTGACCDQWCRPTVFHTPQRAVAVFHKYSAQIRNEFFGPWEVARPCVSLRGAPARPSVPFGAITFWRTGNRSVHPSLCPAGCQMSGAFLSL